MRTAWKATLGVLVLAVVAGFTIPNLYSAKVNWNDIAAIAALRNLASVQKECVARRLIDVDRDGVGEFGTLGELTGAAGIREDEWGKVRAAPLKPPPLSPALANIDDRGIATKSGYCLRVLLPSSRGGPSRESRPGDPFIAAVATDSAEHRWGAYAWPFKRWGELEGESLRHNGAFFADGAGRIWFTWNEDSRYAGPDGGPSWDAAMPEDGWGEQWVDPPADADEYRGRDGNTWRDLETLYRR